MSGALWPALEAQLAELDDRAVRELGELHPEPEGLPPAGSWIRAVQVDDDGHARPMTPWHVVKGWDAPIGCLSMRCRRAPRGTIVDALAEFLGEPLPGWWRRGRRRPRLLVEPGAPAEACKQCEIGLTRDAAAAEAQAAAEAETARQAAIKALLDDDALDDAELGRRLRLIWRAPTPNR